VKDILPKKIGACDIQLIGDGGRIAFAIPASHCLKCSEWAEKISPLGTKVLRFVVAVTSGFDVTTTEDELVDSLTHELPEVLPWEVYESFGNKLGTQETPAALAMSCRRWSSCCIQKSNISTLGTNISKGNNTKMGCSAYLKKYQLRIYGTSV
jgi:hypothetical protein